MPLNRRAKVVTAGIAVLLLAAGCGGSSKKAATPRPTPTLLTAAAAQQLATAAVLTAADLPGYTPQKQTHDASDDASDARIATCLGLPKPVYLARDFGTTFKKEALEIDSSADIALTVPAARAELTGFKGAKASPCIKSEFSSLIVSSGGTITTFEITPVSISVPGSDGAFGYRMTVQAKAGGQVLAFKGFDLGALVGQAEIDLTVLDSSGGPAPYPLAQAVALLTKSADRARAAGA